MKITISGLSGAGTSTVSKILANELGYKQMSGGGIFREMAKSQDMTIYELDEYSKKHPEFDIELDKVQKEYGENNDNFVFESRIGWYFIPDALKIKLVCDVDERMRRIHEREGGELSELIKKTLIREDTYKPRYNGLYEIRDWKADEHFDMIINATKINAKEVVQEIINYINKNYVK